MSTTEIPLGLRENQALEFKSARVLDDLRKSKSDLGRSVVGMLNAEQGEIWIGIREEDSRAVAIESVESPDKAVEAIENHLSTTIEPRPAPGDVTLRVVHVPEGALVVIEVGEGSKRPYAFTRNGNRYYVRVGSRTHDLSPEELVEMITRARATRSEPVALEKAHETFATTRETFGAQYGPRLWTGLRAVSKVTGKVQLDLDALHKSRSLSDASLLDLAWGGVMANERLSVVSKGDVLRVEHRNWGCLEVHEDGLLLQCVPIDRLLDRSSASREDRARNRLRPLIWIANLVFPYRLMGAILESHASLKRGTHSRPLEASNLGDVDVAIDVAMIEASNLWLRPFSPSSHHHDPDFERRLPVREGTWTFVDDVDGKSFVANPDRHALKAVIRFYSQFEFDEITTRGDPSNAVPFEFDRVTGRLRAPQ